MRIIAAQGNKIIKEEDYDQATPPYDSINTSFLHSFFESLSCRESLNILLKKNEGHEILKSLNLYSDTVKIKNAILEHAKSNFSLKTPEHIPAPAPSLESRLRSTLKPKPKLKP